MAGTIQQQYLNVVICTVAQVTNILFGPNVTLLLAQKKS
jgi:hypothetical protein